MPLVLRHLAAISLLPFVVTVIVPWYLLSRAGDSRWDATALVTLPARIAGVFFLCGGVALFSWCVALFARLGKGTLAPWDPTQALVAVGPYRFVRNPMITGVALILARQALFFGSWRLAAWTGTFILLNHLYFLALEEPGLRRRFGESYGHYAAEVPRWLPRVGRPLSRPSRRSP